MEQKPKTKEEYIQSLPLISDVLSCLLFGENKNAVKILLDIILEKDLEIISCTPQRTIRNVRIDGKSVRFDVAAVNKENECFDIEFQIVDDGADTRRARFNSSLLDSVMLDQGKTYSDLKDSYVIFITYNDVLGGNQPIYHLERQIRELQKPANDGSHIIYVNCSYSGECRENLRKLIHDMKSSDPDKMEIADWAYLVKYYKREEGAYEMEAKLDDFMQDYCNAITQQVTQQVTQQGIRILIDTMLEFGTTDEEIILTLIKKYNLSEKQASDVYEQYVNSQD